MTLTPRPHDLLWLRADSVLMSVKETWVSSHWNAGLPVVVRRDVITSERIPVGVRGVRREQRAAAWVQAADILHITTPEMLVECALNSPFADDLPIQALLALDAFGWPWRWGVTGSVGYALATAVPVLHSDSDLDLTIRAPQPLARDLLQKWQAQTGMLPCRVDTQIEAPSGAFALSEWLREGRALVKTATGPVLSDSPWTLGSP